MNAELCLSWVSLEVGEGVTVDELVALSEGVREGEGVGVAVGDNVGLGAGLGLEVILEEGVLAKHFAHSNNGLPPPCVPAPWSLELKTGAREGPENTPLPGTVEKGFGVLKKMAWKLF